MSTKEDELILAGLTPEERAALAEPDDESTTATQEELEAQAAAAGAATTKDDDDEDDKKEPAAAGADPAGTVAAVAPAAAAQEPVAAEPAAAAAGEPSGTSQPAAPVFVAKAPDDAAEQLKALATKKEELLAKHDDGDITTAEFQAELDTIGKEERKIERAIDRAEIAAEMKMQQEKNQWDADCQAFIDANAMYKTDQDLFQQLNETVIAYAKMPRNASLSGPQVLAKAHAAVMLERGTPVAPAAAAGKPKLAVVPKPDLPPSLGSMPAASGADVGEGKWASLDALQTKNPAAYEAALSKLSEADRDAYLQA